MNDKLDEQKIEERREFLKKAGKVAITVPAVALLLKATSMPAHAQVIPSGVVDPPLPA